APFGPCGPCRWFCRARNFRRSRGASPDAVLPDKAADYADASQSLFLFWSRISRGLPPITRCIRARANSTHLQNFIAPPQISERFRHFVGFAKTDTHFSVVIARHDQGTKAETTSAFHHLRAAIDKNDFLGCITSGRRGFVGTAIGSSAWIR